MIVVRSDQWVTRALFREMKPLRPCAKCSRRSRAPKRHHKRCPLRGAGTRRYLLALIRRVSVARVGMDRTVSGREMHWLARHLDVFATITGVFDEERFVEAFDRTLDRYAGVLHKPRRYPLPKQKVALVDHGALYLSGPALLTLPDGAALFDASHIPNDDSAGFARREEQTEALRLDDDDPAPLPPIRVDAFFGVVFRSPIRDEVIVFARDREDPRLPAIVETTITLAEIAMCPDWLAERRTSAREATLRGARLRAEGSMVTTDDVLRYGMGPDEARRYQPEHIAYTLDVARDACAAKGPIVTHKDRLRVIRCAVEMLRQATAFYPRNP